MIERMKEQTMYAWMDRWMDGMIDRENDRTNDGWMRQEEKKAIF